MSVFDRFIQWWESWTYPQDEEMNERVKQIHKDLANNKPKNDLPPKVKSWDWSENPSFSTK